MPYLFRRRGRSTSLQAQTPPLQMRNKQNKQNKQDELPPNPFPDVAVGVSRTAASNTSDYDSQQPHQTQIRGNTPRSIRQRFANKASTFSLRIKSSRLDRERYIPPSQSGTDTLHSGETYQPCNTDESLQTPKARSAHLKGSQGSTLTRTSDEKLLLQAPPIAARQSFNFERPGATSFLESVAVQFNRILQQQYPHPSGSELGTDGKAKWTKMASGAAAPPVPYARLKDIATQACDAALTETTKYDHSATEIWNSKIINSILSTLVQETTPSSTSSSGKVNQPQFKYVVNSTIIQHAAAPTSEAGKFGGRRGMHSASGAYWNNEKDGMWSFKYEAAEGKGLDIVVGITWVWVG